MEDDNHSICSTTSITNEKILCPHCKESIQQRAILNHLRIKHEEDFLLGIKSIKTLQKTIKDKTPLELILYLPDERDDEDLSIVKKVILYAVLGTDKTTNKAFTNESRAKGYLKKNPKSLKLHLEQLNDILQQLKDANKLKETYLRGGIWLQTILKKSHHYLTYVKAPIENLKQKDIDVSDYVTRVDALYSEFMKELSLLPTDPKAIILRPTYMKFGKFYDMSERIFINVVSKVDEVYDYPDWVERDYQKCCTENYPEGRRLGCSREWWINLSYPGDPGTYIDEN
jgi:hypothetical protein